MPLVQLKPTSAGTRHQVKVVTPGLWKGEPYGPLLEKQSSTGGRNNHGRITTRHKGGGEKQHYRLIDFKLNKDGDTATVDRIDFDPYRTPHNICSATCKESEWTNVWLCGVAVSLKK